MNLLLDAAYGVTLLPHYLIHRYITGKYGPKADQKLGRLPSRTTLNRPCLWLHAVSVGEVLAARGLIRAFESEYPEWDLRISVTTHTGREVAETNFGPERVIYYPLDFSSAVTHALDAIRPSLIVLMELEVWPHFLRTAAARGIPVAVANARITERSAQGFQRFGRLARSMLDAVSLWLPQTQQYAQRLRGLGVDAARIQTVGSVKYDAVPAEIDPEERDRVRALLGVDATTPVLLGGSTHPSEEEHLLRAWATVNADRPEPTRLVLVPRHPERLDEVERLASSHAPVTRRTQVNPDSPCRTPILLVDTMGELGSLYAAADLVFVGGTLIDHGGQNIMEPCGLARPVVIGPSIYNFEEAAALLRNADGLRQISGPAELLPAIQAMLADPASAAAMGTRGRQTLVAQRGATDRTLTALKELIETHAT